MNPISRQREGFQNFTRGAEIWLHQTRMMFSSMLMILAAALAIGFVGIYVGIMSWASKDEMYYSQKYMEASFKGFIFPETGKVTLLIDGHEMEVSPGTAKEVARPFKEMAIWKIYVLSMIGLLICGVSFFVLILSLTKYGGRKMKDDHLRGGKLTTGDELKNQLLEKNEASPYSMAGVPLRKNSETLHCLVTGATGTGKSVAILEMLDQIRSQGKRAAVYDPTGKITETFYRPGKDIILNPLDARCPRWTPWNEIRASYDYLNIVEGLIPLPHGMSEPFFPLAGRQLLEDTCIKLAEAGRMTNKALYESMAIEEIDKIYAMLKGTAGAAYIAPKTEKTGHNIRMVVINALTSFRFLRDDGENFSLRNWLEKEDDDSWLFISAKETQKTALKPLISLWVSILIRYAMDLKPVYEPRLWLVIDELAGLHKLETLELGLTNLRKYGVPMLNGVQQFSQLIEIYGPQVAKTIISMSQTKLVLRVGDGDTAEVLARLFGKAEIDEKEETYSYGLNSQRDGVSVFARRQMREIVMPSEILTLPDLTGYLAIPGDYPVAKVSYTYRNREEIASGFIERSGFEVDIEEENNQSAALMDDDVHVSGQNTQDKGVLAGL